MDKKVVCPRCGKEVDRVCSSCWRCKDCIMDCKQHMKRTINGNIDGSKKEKK